MAWTFPPLTLSNFVAVTAPTFSTALRSMLLNFQPHKINSWTWADGVQGQVSIL